jgi:iron complex transport system substrate-binding protein
VVNLLVDVEANRRRRAEATEPHPARVAAPLAPSRPLTGAAPIGYLRPVGSFRILALAAALAACIMAPSRARAGASMRIVSLAPSVTETLFALGAGADVAGVSDYCDYPPAAARLPHVGSFLTPNIEAIIALRPTLVIGLGLSSDLRELHAIEATGCAVMTVRDESLEQIEDSIAAVGARVGRAPAAAALLARMRAQIGAVRERLAGVRPVRVLMLVGHEPIIAVGRRTYLDQLLRIARADNIADASSEQWPRLSVEYIIAMHPDVILDGQMGSEATPPERFWDKYETIPAVKNHRVYGYPQDPILHPGPRVGKSLEMLAKMIHPRVFIAPAQAAR